MTDRSTIAVVFDFDDTLAPDTTSSFLSSLGIDVPRFWADTVQARIDNGWDPIPAYLYEMIRLSGNGAAPPITRSMLARFGRNVTFYPGVTRIFSRLDQHLRSVNTEARLEYYLISSGIGDILRATRISTRFNDIWACDFHTDHEERILFPRRVVSFTDKTRHLFQIAKGIVGPDFANRPFEVNKKVPDDQIRIPFSQMIVVGDGYTDVPCFSMVRKNGGIAIGVFDEENREKWGRAWGFIEDDRVSNLVPADYRKNSALDHSLRMAVENMAHKIALRHQTYQG